MDGNELRCSRIRRRKSTREMAQLIGKSESSYNNRENGKIEVTIEESALIGSYLDMEESEFFAVFYDGKLPFRKNRAAN